MSLPQPLQYHKIKIMPQMVFGRAEPVKYGLAHLLREIKSAKQ